MMWASDLDEGSELVATLEAADFRAPVIAASLA
jgi:hypothetical protein